jgi:hypothetical protein
MTDQYTQKSANVERKKRDAHIKILPNKAKINGPFKKNKIYLLKLKFSNTH